MFRKKKHGFGAIRPASSRYLEIQHQKQILIPMIVVHACKSRLEMFHRSLTARDANHRDGRAPHLGRKTW
jgi:hypothetical protein